MIEGEGNYILVTIKIGQDVKEDLYSEYLTLLTTSISSDLRKQTQLIEYAQRNATIMVTKLSEINNKEKSEMLKLLTVEERRIKGDISTFKFSGDHDDDNKD